MKFSLELPWCRAEGQKGKRYLWSPDGNCRATLEIDRDENCEGEPPRLRVSSRELDSDNDTAKDGFHTSVTIMGWDHLTALRDLIDIALKHMPDDDCVSLDQMLASVKKANEGGPTTPQ